MDESLRMRMGMGMPYTTKPQRRSIDDHRISSSPKMGPMRRSTGRVPADQRLEAEDFQDVFGGPPRSVLSRKFSGEFNFYEEVFRLPGFGTPAPAKGGRSLPAFRIPGGNAGFYGDVFGDYGGGGGWRSRDRSRPLSKSKSKSNSSSVLSSEEVSPLRPASRDDVQLSSFASKLRPLNVPSRWNSEKETNNQTMPMPSFPYLDSNQSAAEIDAFNKTSTPYYGFSRHVSSPETVSLRPNNSFHSIKISVDDLILNSPSSTPDSSICQEVPERTTKVSLHDDRSRMHDQEVAEMDDSDDDEAMSSYVIEITSDHREGNAGEAVSIDEAIAWAKEKYQSTPSSDKQTEERTNIYEFFHQQGHGMNSPTEEEHNNWLTEEEKEQAEAKIEMDMLDGDVQLWSSGKENNILSLLSSLHHVLWENSGWYPVALTNLKESSEVKKAYQKARLCLHPDKLQQRGATLLQKYVAEKAFAILQDAWAHYINLDVL
ncbi:uncharacterized protein [Rutidosis leptorrhynchoides]|uniref:uncharacterized protein n=1 Tax=Rutidosis leptorrhynchoides TaxID=125765 RepID=UPI003A9A3664